MRAEIIRCNKYFKRARILGLRGDSGGAGSGWARGREAIEGTLEVLQLSGLAGNQVDADNVEANFRRRGKGELAEVTAGETAHDAALVFIDGCVGRRSVADATGFDFNTAEQAALPGNQVHIAGHVP